MCVDIIWCICSICVAVGIFGMDAEWEYIICVGIRRQMRVGCVRERRSLRCAQFPTMMRRARFNRLHELVGINCRKQETTTTYSLFASLWYKIRMTRRESVNGISTKLVCPWWARGVYSSSCQGEEKSWFGQPGTSPGILGEDKTDVKDGTERKDALGENCTLLNVEFKGKSVVLEPRHH